VNAVAVINSHLAQESAAVATLDNALFDVHVSRCITNM